MNLVSYPKRYPVYLLLIGIVLCFALLSYFLFSYHSAQRSLQCETSINLAKEKVHTLLKQHETILYSFRNLYEERSGIVVRDVFDLYASIPVQTLAGLHGVGFAQVIRRSSEQTFVFNARREGYIQYTIHPPLMDSIGLVGLYLTPPESHPALSGYNFLSDSTHRSQMLLARDNNSLLLLADNLHSGQMTAFLPIYAPARESVEDVFRAQPSTQRQLLQFMDTLMLQSKIQSHKQRRFAADTTSLVARRNNFSGMVFFQIDLKKLLDSLVGQVILQYPQTTIRYTLFSGSVQSSHAILLQSSGTVHQGISEQTIAISFAGATLWLYCSSHNNTEFIATGIIFLFGIVLLLCGALIWHLRLRTVEQNGRQ